MTRFDEELERREGPRRRRPVACTLLFDGRCHPGRVRDISPSGLFIETDGEPPLAAEAVVSLRTPAGARVVLEGSILRRSQAAHSLSGLANRGVILRITDAPPAYRDWVWGEVAA